MLGFSPLICEYQGWAQGGLGTVILVAGLIFAVGLMVYFRWTGAIPWVIGGALAMYYGVPIIESMFHWDQDCAVVRARFSQEEQYAANTRVCESNLFSSDAQTGEDCSCNGESATPQCQSYYSACEGNLDGYETSNNYCSCSMSDMTSRTVPSCLNYPASYKPAYSSNFQMDCASVDTTWGESPYCTDTTPNGTHIPQKADWVGPVPKTYEPVNAHAYYTMQTQIDNTTGASISATWYGDADDVSWYYLNGQQIAYNPASKSLTTLEHNPVIIPPGVSTFDITVLNDDPGAPDKPNPSGVASEVVSQSGDVLTATRSSSWQEVSGPPTAPNPPPPTATTDCYTQSCAG